MFERKPKKSENLIFTEQSTAKGSLVAEWNTRHMVLGLFCATAFSCILLFSNPRIETAFILIVFNFLFASLTFPLSSSLVKKVSVLVIGNIAGSSCNFFFYVLVDAIPSYFRIRLIPLTLILGSFMNLAWIVTFFGMSLAFLANPQTRRTRAKS